LRFEVSNVRASGDYDGDGAYEQTGLEPGFVAWVPIESGFVEARVHASDGDGGEGEFSQTYSVMNLPPFLVELPPDELFQGDELRYDLQVGDPGVLDTVTAELADAPEGMTLDGLRLEWDPAGAALGVTPYDLVLTDDEGASVTYFLRVAVIGGEGCTCATASSRPSVGVAWVLLVLVGRRRRARLHW